jgi:hypothetical protein
MQMGAKKEARVGDGTTLTKLSVPMTLAFWSTTFWIEQDPTQ